MTTAAARKAERFADEARAAGWTVKRVSEDLDGVASETVTATRGGWGAMVAFYVTEAGRVAAMRLGGDPRAAVVLMSTRGADYWFGPLAAWPHLLADPAAWAGLST